MATESSENAVRRELAGTSTEREVRTIEKIGSANRPLRSASRTIGTKGTKAAAISAELCTTIEGATARRRPRVSMRRPRSGEEIAVPRVAAVTTRPASR